MARFLPADGGAFRRRRSEERIQTEIQYCYRKRTEKDEASAANAKASFGATKQPGTLLSTTTGTDALKLPSDDEASNANAKASFGATKQPGALKQTAQTPLRRSKRTRTPRKLY